MLQLEPQILQQAASGDRHAFARLYQHFVGRVYAIAWRLLANRSRAEDAVQETFLKVWQQLPAFRGDSEFSTWLHRLAVNTALMELRSRRSRPLEDDDEEALDTFGHPDSAGHVTALSMDLGRAVASLPPRARAVLVLYDVEGWKHEEIAAELGMAVGSSKAQLHRARHLLRERLGVHA